MKIYFEWTKDISVGNDTIDHQHQKLLAQVNKILNEIVGEIEPKEVEEAINFLDEYIKEHLSFEEEYMEKIKYPQLEEHRAKHHEFIKKYYEFKEDYKEGADKEKLITEIESYVGEWWINHIGKEDKKYQLFLEKEMNPIK